MLEDDAYRTSSQYRFWSYISSQLAELRRQSNEQASERVKAAFQRVREAKRHQDAAENGKTSLPPTPELKPDEKPIDTLTVEEELKVIQWGATKIVEMGGAMTPPIPFDIRVRL